MAEEESSSNPTIVYLGDDKSYWETIQYRIKDTYDQKEFDYADFYDEKYYLVFLELLDLIPVMIYVDLSHNFDSQLQLLHLIKQEPTLKHIPCVALVDKKENLVHCRMTGAEFAHLKCGEYHDVVFDPFFLVYPAEVKKTDFALAKFEREVELHQDFKIGYYTPAYVHIEGNVKFTKGELVELKTNLPTELVPSANYIVSEVCEGGLRFDYKYSYNLKFVYVDKPELEEDEEDPEGAKKRYNERLADYEINLKKSKKKIHEWVADRQELSAKEKTKIMVVDRDMTIFQSDEAKNLENAGHSLRFSTCLTEEMDEIDRLRPDLIVFQFPQDEVARMARAEEEGDDEEEEERENSPIDQLTAIAKKIHSIEKYSPFLLVFNSARYSSQSLQESFKYPLILANANPMSLKYLIELADMFFQKQDLKMQVAIKKKVEALKKQDPVKYRKLTTADFSERKFTPRENDPLSNASSKHSIVLQSMTESELTFLTDVDFDLGMYHMMFPVEIGVSLVPEDGNKCQIVSGQNLYKGLIHSTDELDKQEIRQFVNTIFFKDLDEKQKAEKEEFEAKNKEVQEQKEQEAKEAEEAARIAAEEEARKRGGKLSNGDDGGSES